VDAGLPENLDEFPIDDEKYEAPTHDKAPTHDMPQHETSKEVRREYNFFPSQTSYDDLDTGPSTFGPSQPSYGQLGAGPSHVGSSQTWY
jgi:hypothetical protein